MERVIRAAAVQCAAGAALPAVPPDEWRGADLLAFPEYWRCGPDVASYAAAATGHYADLERLAALSAALDTVVVAGTLVAARAAGGFENRAYVLDRGRVAGTYAKVHPMEGEVAGGIAAGSAYRLVETRGFRLGLLVCSDVLFPGTFAAVGSLGPDVVVVPTSSPYRPEDTIAEKEARDRDIFVAGAAAAGAYVVKVCTLGAIFGHPLQGRSLIAAPWGVLERVPVEGEQAPCILRAPLDLDALAAWRQETAWKRPEPRARRIERATGKIEAGQRLK